MKNISPDKLSIARKLRVTARGTATVGGCLVAVGLFFFSGDLAAWYYSANDPSAQASPRTDTRTRKLPKKKDWVEVDPYNRRQTPVIEPEEEVQVASFIRHPARSFERSVIVSAKRPSPVRRLKQRRTGLKVNPELISYTLVIYPKDGEIRTRVEPAKAVLKRPAAVPAKIKVRSGHSESTINLAG